MSGAGNLSTRNEILHLLKTRGFAEARALAVFCGLTTMAIRRHLLRLQLDGLIHARTQRRPRGRPTTLYSLTESGQAQFPRDYEGFATDLLSRLAELDGEDKVKQVLRQRSDHMTSQHFPRMKGKSLEKRVREVAAILTEGGYMAEVKPLGRGRFLLTELNCAIPRVAKSFPHICEEELGFIRRLVQAQVTRVSHMLTGACHCSYLIQGKRSARTHLSPSPQNKNRPMASLQDP
jgi:predicted ArsR family transcriptional regulator